MKAYRLTPGSPPRMEDVPEPEPGPAEVVVRVAGAGACHSDLHLMDGMAMWTNPFTLGHENTGWVEALGPGVDGWSEGDAVAVDGARDKLDLAREIGADDGVTPDNVGGPAELILDFVGSADTMALAASLARPLSHVTVVGLAMGTLPFNIINVRWECSVQTTYWGSVTELAEVIALARNGKIAAHVERFALADAPEAYQRMRDGTLRGRAVIVPNEATR